MSRIAGMAPEDRWRCSRSLSTPKVEAPSSILTSTPAPLLEGPALANPSEMGSSEADPSDIIIFFI